MDEYIDIPLNINFDKSPIIDRESADVECGIDNILDLIVFTPKGTFNADPEFGFEYWNHEFSNIDVREFNNNYIGLISNVQNANDVTRQQCEDSIKESILKYEPRLLHPRVKIELGASSAPRNRKRQSKYEISIVITGEINDGLGVNRPYVKHISFLVEPVARKFSL